VYCSHVQNLVHQSQGSSDNPNTSRESVRNCL